MREIPGWKQIPSRPKIGTAMYGQEVDGKWYIPDDGTASLQKLVDEWMEHLWSDYRSHTFVGKDGQRFGVISDGDHAIRILREWGKLDKKGNIIEG